MMAVSPAGVCAAAVAPPCHSGAEALKRRRRLVAGDGLHGLIPTAPCAMHASRNAPRRVRAGVMLVLACAFLSACSAARPGSAGSTVALRVMTYNIFGGHDLERRSNLVRVAALIDSLRPDFVLLQEVDRLTARSGRVDQADTLGRRTGMRVIFGRAMDYDGGEYGIAILSRWPIRSSNSVPLTIAPAVDTTPRPVEPRILLHVAAQTPAGVVHVINTHLDHQAGSGARPSQLVQLLAYIADSIPPAATVVLGGDFNALPEAPEVRALRVAFSDAWARCGSGAGHTFRSDRPARRIDYLMLAGTRCERAEVITTRLSDHYPLVVDLQAATHR